MINMKLISAATVGMSLAFSTGVFAQDKQHDVATFVSGGATGTWFPTATAISEMVNEAYDGQPVSTIPGKGAIGNALAVGSGKAEFGLSYGPFLLGVYNGNNEILESEGMKDLRAVASVVPNTTQIVLAGDVPETIFADVKNGAKLRIGENGGAKLDHGSAAMLAVRAA